MSNGAVEKLKSHLPAIQSLTELDDCTAEQIQCLLSLAMTDVQLAEVGLEAKDVLTLKERLGQHSEYLKQLRGKQHTGIIQKTIPALDDATMGLQALNCIAGGPASGKTTFVQQACIDALHADGDTCCLFVSLEMSEQALVTRWKSRVLNKPYRELLTKNTDEDLAEADRLVSLVADRIYLLDSSGPPVTAELIIRLANQLKKLTKCNRVIVAIDYLQIFPIPPHEAAGLRSEQAEDEYRVEQIQKIKQAIAPDPMLVITEINKTDHFRAEGLHSVKGSSRITFAADSVFLFNPLSDNDLVDRIIKTGTHFIDGVHRPAFRLRTRKEREEARETKKTERETAIEALREEMQKADADFVEINICKARAPGITAKIVVQHKYKISDMKEINENGVVDREGFDVVAPNPTKELEDLFG